jgi:mono/diheme cytochrome c family protein
LAIALSLLFVVGIASSRAATETPDPVPKVEYAGISLFKTYCSTCHGVAAKGDGPMADQLRFHPPDLTQLSKRHGGRFPADDVFRMIDGRKPLKGHGGGDMPVWGDTFKNSREGYDDESVKAKITALVEYLEGIQEREPAKP